MPLFNLVFIPQYSMVNQEPILLPDKFFPIQTMEIIIFPWPAHTIIMEANPPNPMAPQPRQEESSPMVVPIFMTSLPQVLTQSYPLVDLNGLVQNLEVTQDLENLEETLALTREI